MHHTKIQKLVSLVGTPPPPLLTLSMSGHLPLLGQGAGACVFGSGPPALVYIGLSQGFLAFGWIDEAMCSLWVLQDVIVEQRLFVAVGLLLPTRTTQRNVLPAPPPPTRTFLRGEGGSGWVPVGVGGCQCGWVGGQGLGPPAPQIRGLVCIMRVSKKQTSGGPHHLCVCPLFPLRKEACSSAGFKVLGASVARSVIPFCAVPIGVENAGH